MHRLIWINISLLFGSVLNVKAQYFKQVDATTYELYQNSDWEGLKRLGEQHAPDQFDYYYYNVRMGVAYFQLKEYYKAEEYLTRAIANSDLDFPKEYLFWTYTYLGEEELATQLYFQFDETIRSRLNMNNSAVKSFDLETGAKFPDDNTLGTGKYINGSLTHALANNWNLSYQLSLFGQNKDYSNFRYTQYGASAHKTIGTKSISLGGYYGKTYSNLPLTSTTEYTTGETNLHSYGMFAGISKRYQRLRLGGFVTLTGLRGKVEYQTLDSSPGVSFPPVPVFSTSATHYENQSAIAFTPTITTNYTLPFWKDAVTLGMDISPVNGTSGSFLNFRPSLSAKFSDKLWLKADYLSVGDYLFYDLRTGVSYNNFQTKKLTTSLNYAFTSRVSGRLTYSFEDVQDPWENANYNMNSLFIGINLKLNRND